MLSRWTSTGAWSSTSVPSPPSSTATRDRAAEAPKAKVSPVSAVSGGCRSWQSGESSQGCDGQRGRHGDGEFGRHRDIGNSHHVVVVHDRGRRPRRGQQPPRGGGALFARVVGRHDPRLVDAVRGRGGEEGPGTALGVQQFRRVGDAGDAPVAEPGEVVDDLGHPRASSAQTLGSRPWCPGPPMTMAGRPSSVSSPTRLTGGAVPGDAVAAPGQRPGRGGVAR